MTEKQFEAQVTKWLHTQGIYKLGTNKQDKKVKQVGFYFIHFGGGFSASGIPDIIGCVNSTFIGLELKAPKGVASKIQEINIDTIKECNGYGDILYPKDFEAFKTKIKEMLM